jgi:hypothetical protein
MVRQRVGTVAALPETAHTALHFVGLLKTIAMTKMGEAKMVSLPLRAMPNPA